MRWQLSHIKQIATGADYMWFITKDGYLYGFGSNQLGQLGLENTSKSIVINIPTRVPGLNNVVHVSGGPSSVHTLVVVSQ